MFWTIDNDDFRSACGPRPFPLIEAAKEALYGKDAAIKTYDLFYDFSHSLLIPSFPSFPISCTAQLDFSSFLQFSIFFRFSATSVSISTSEQTRVERLRLTRKQLAALARYTLLHLSNHQSTVLNTQLEFSLLFKEALPCFELLIFSSAHTAAEKHYLFRIFKSKAKLHLCRSVINSLLTFTPHKVRLMSRITPRHLPYLKS